MKLLLATTFLAVLVVVILPVHGQIINNPCAPSTLATFTPCMNFLTNSSGAGTSSPTSDCCGSLKNLTSTGMDCLCLIVTASVPFRVPINRSLAISLPRACNMPGVPVQCKASRAPTPAPGPASIGPTLSPGGSPAATPRASVAPEPTPSSEAPVSDTTPGAGSTPPSPPSPDVGSAVPDNPTTTPGDRPVLTPPSSAMASDTVSPYLLLLALGFVALKYY